MTLSVLLGALTAAVVTLGALALLLPWLRRLGVIDVPVGRSLHTRPVVRGAGLALLPGILVGTAVTEILLDRENGEMVTVSSALYLAIAVATVLAFAAVGLSDDFFTHGVLGRLVLQVGFGAIAAAGLLLARGEGLTWVLAVSLVLVAAVNVTNFMDGANGLLALHGIVTSAWFCLLAATQEVASVIGLTVAAGGALLAFLPVNLRGRAFLGDVGSYALGALWGVLSVLLIMVGLPVECVLAPAAVFLADFAYTLQLRVRAGDRWYQAHKLHVYQRLISAGWPHVASSGLTAAMALALSLLSVPALLGAGPALRIVCILAGLLLLGAYLRLPVIVGAPVPWHSARSQGGGVARKVTT